MKYLFSLFLCGLAALGVSAQTQRGTWLLGTSSQLTGGFGGYGWAGDNPTDNQVSLGFFTRNIQNPDGSNNRSSAIVVNAAPSVGYFVADGLLVGGSVGLFHFSDNDFIGGITAVSATPAVRFYLPGSRRLRWYGEGRGGATYRWSTLGDEDGGSETRPLWGGKLGAAWLVSPKTSLDFFLDYTGTRFHEEVVGNRYTVTESTFGLGVGLNFFL
jgi:hypothetical protein